jgi:hypothetical protein
MSFMKGDLLSKTRKLMKGGIIARPRWLDAVMRYVSKWKLKLIHTAWAFCRMNSLYVQCRDSGHL